MQGNIRSVVKKMTAPTTKGAVRILKERENEKSFITDLNILSYMP